MVPQNRKIWLLSLRFLGLCSKLNSYRRIFEAETLSGVATFHLTDFLFRGASTVSTYDISSFDAPSVHKRVSLDKIPSWMLKGSIVNGISNRKTNRTDYRTAQRLLSILSFYIGNKTWFRYYKILVFIILGMLKTFLVTFVIVLFSFVSCLLTILFTLWGLSEVFRFCKVPLTMKNCVLKIEMGFFDTADNL